MNGIHDLGGMQGFGPVESETNEPVFHNAWEGRVLALNRAMGYARLWNIDMSRAAIEKMPPDLYLTRSYYAKWLLRLEDLLIERGLIDADELAAGHGRSPGKLLPRKLADLEARGRVGTIECVRGCHVFPDTVAIGAGENPQWLYTLRFAGRELWGESADPSLTVSIEAFEPYLEAI